MLQILERTTSRRWIWNLPLQIATRKASSRRSASHLAVPPAELPDRASRPNCRSTSIRKTYFLDPFVVPEGVLPRIDYVVYVPPEGLFCAADHGSPLPAGARHQPLNDLLEGKQFICVGPGRWGSSNSDLGVASIMAISTIRARWSKWPAGDWPGAGAFAGHAFLPGPARAADLPAGDLPE
jgi:hypothetical protein